MSQVCLSPPAYTFIRLTACKKAFSIHSNGQVWDGFSRQAWIVGCSKCETCLQERKEKKRQKWAGRLRVMIDWWQKEKGPVVFKTLTVHDEDYPDEATLRRRLQRLIRNKLRKVSKTFKYWIVCERGAKTNRLHAHIFFFLTKEDKWRIINDVMDDFWFRHFRAYITHHRVVDSGKMAANYAAKYGAKAIGFRVMNSQFGWMPFMDERRSEWLGIIADLRARGGVREFVNVNEEERLKSQMGASRRSPGDLLQSVTNFTVSQRVVAATPTLSPVRQVLGGIRCEENGERTETLIMSRSHRLLPASSILSDASPFGQARRLQAYAVASALHQTLLTTSSPQGP